jgi:hypothetical protein
MTMNPEKLIEACRAIRKDAAARDQQAKESAAAGMIESGAVQRNRAAGMREALAILESYLGKEATGA